MSLFGTNTVASHWGWQNRWYDGSAPWSGAPQILTASDAAASDYFGTSVDMAGDGNYCIIGAPREDTSPLTDNGAAYIFYKSGGVWAQQAKIVAGDRVGSDLFGTSVGINQAGDTVIIGSMLSGANEQGAAYIFIRSGTIWSLQSKIVANNPTNNNYFGRSVSISADGNTIAVGANGNQSVYVFTRTGTVWARQTTITGGTTDYGYAISLSADGNTMAVGAKSEAIDSSRQGTVSIYSRTAGIWTLQQKLLSPYGYGFGASVSISGDGNTIGIGSDSLHTGGIDATGPWVYIKDNGTWVLQASFGVIQQSTSTIPALNYDGNIMAISSDGQNGGVSPTSLMYNRTGTTWTLVNTITYPSTSDISTPNAFDNSGDSLLVGVGGSDIVALNAGAAYIYSK